MDEQKTPVEPHMSQQPEAKKGQGALSKYLTPLAIVIAGLIVAIAILNTRSTPKTDTTGKTADPTPTASVNIKDVNTNDGPSLGKSSAPVVLAYWSDYQCPFCKQFETTTMSDLIKNYVDPGKVRIVFKDYQFLGADSTTAALYARAVWDLYQDKFFDWREAMFNKQDAEGGGFGDEASIVDLTKTISGIDVAKVQQAVKDKKTTYQKAIDADKAEGTKFGVQGTPGFITGKQLISGAAAYAKFTQAIDAQLK